MLTNNNGTRKKKVLNQIKKFIEEYVYEPDMSDIVAIVWILMFAGFLIFINSIPTNAKEVDSFETSYGTAHEVYVTYYTGDEENEWFGSHGERLEYGMCAYTPDSYGKFVVLYTISKKGSKIILGSYEIRDTGSNKFFANSKGILNGDCSARLDLWFECEEDAKAEFKKWSTLIGVEEEDLEIYMVLVNSLKYRNGMERNHYYTKFGDVIEIFN